MSGPRATCKHGNVGACGFCLAEGEPRCSHGHPFYCGHCGPLASLRTIAPVLLATIPPKA